MLRLPEASDWARDDSLVEFLAERLLDGQLVLVLGSGISLGTGLPSWAELVGRLYDRPPPMPRPPDDDLPRLAEAYRRERCGNNPARFIAAVQEELYRTARLDFADLRSDRLLQALGAIIVASQRGSIAHVITFNFDDVLERYLRYFGLTVRSIGDPGDWGGKEDVMVMHPHGFVPSEPGEQPSRDLVFDQLEYSRIIGDDSNPWRQLLLTTMRRHTCLFVGLRRRDSHMDSLVAAVMDDHPQVRVGDPFWAVSFDSAAAADSYDKLLWEQRRVYCRADTEYTEELPLFLLRICQRAAALRRARGTIGASLRI